ncbi:MAG: HAMP domain-containing sensor histidine kinase [Firmicutes bacterium]|nr:HAMP domain-containing sensor histidine kinase [Bacillota bacterium]
MNTREMFQKARHQAGNPFGLRARLTIMVTLEMLFCTMVVFAVSLLLHKVLRFQWEVPLTVESIPIYLVIGGLVTSLLSKVFLKPINELRQAMARVADGDYSVRLDAKSTSKEIMELNTGFNMMAAELSATEILQTDFVSNVSHEFKTPINAIEGYSMLLQDSENLDEDQKQYVEKILYNTNRLSSLVGNILLLSRLENQQIPTNRTRYRLDEQIRQSIVALDPVWEKKDIVFDAELERLEYLGNESMMYHVWDNLIGNAIKFSPDGGTVRIRLAQREEQILFTIENSGAGLSEEAQKHIFDNVYQADSSHRQEGNGLGLALVKRILVIENGRIGVENLPEGGCRFTVTLLSA